MRTFAILPAAGQSRRMGQPKLLLPFKGDTVLERVLQTWRGSVVRAVVVVIAPGAARLADVCRASGVHVVEARSQPVDMKASVRLGLDYVRKHFRPEANDAWLLAPADMPLLQPDTIDRLIAAAAQSAAQGQDAIFVVRHGQRNGHPVLFPWKLAADVFKLAEDEGIDRLRRRHPSVYVSVPDPGCLSDLDTPGDYSRLLDRAADDLPR
jgi:molybdenum cofactor cytidylyltransferase